MRSKKVKLKMSLATVLVVAAGLTAISSSSAYAECPKSPVRTNEASAPASQPPSAPLRDGQSDFDFEIGEWKTQVRVLRNPLSGKPAIWVEYEGVSVVRALMNGRANIVELSVSGLSGRIEGVSLRLYEPKLRRWSLNFASLRDGEMTAPVIGSFDATGRGVFYGDDTLNGCPVRVRFVITQMSAKEAHFDQAFSADEGKTWETNWIAVDTRQ